MTSQKGVQSDEQDFRPFRGREKKKKTCIVPPMVTHFLSNFYLLVPVNPLKTELSPYPKVTFNKPLFKIILS